MPRIAGVDLPKNKRMVVALQYIYGIGPTRAKEILTAANVEYSVRAKDVTGEEATRIRGILEGQYQVEGDLRRERQMAIKRLMDLGCHRGLRHRRGLPVRGQRTRTNARTRKGPVKQAIAGKKMPGKK